MSAVLVALGGFPLIVAGCVFYGIGMAGWPLQLGLLRRETPAGQIGWRTAIYRVGVDGGIFLGPFLSGNASPKAWTSLSCRSVAREMLACPAAFGGGSG